MIAPERLLVRIPLVSPRRRCRRCKASPSPSLDHRRLDRQVRRRGGRLNLEHLEGRALFSTFTVWNTDNDGIGSLRQAIFEADLATGENVIDATGVVGTIRLTSALPPLGNGIDLRGPGSGFLAVRRDAAARFGIFTVPEWVTVAVSGLTIAGGLAPFGGGIEIDGNLTVRGCTITGNEASGKKGTGGSGGDDKNGDGGGIFNSLSGHLTLIDSTVAQNLASDSGGGIANQGYLIVYGSTLAGNRAGRDGGGLSNDDVENGWSTVSAILTNCTISGNQAGRNGGGVFTSLLGETELSFDTITANDVTGAGTGGGVYIEPVRSFRSQAPIKVDTIPPVFSDPSLLPPGPFLHATAPYPSGEGIHFAYTIVAGNHGIHPDVSGDVLFTMPSFAWGFILGHNLIGDGAGSSGWAIEGGLPENDRVGTSEAPIDPRLSPLGDHGGPTRTHALLPSSPAIGENSLLGGPSTDQRGVLRDWYPDAGAYEVNEGGDYEPWGYFSEAVLVIELTDTNDAIELGVATGNGLIRVQIGGRTIQPYDPSTGVLPT